MKNYSILLMSFCGIFGMLSLTNCNNKCECAEEDVMLDTTMIKLLCPPGKDIFTGSDGAVSIVISEDKSLWIWGDAFMGEVIDNQRGTPETTPLIMGNIFVEQEGENVKTICGGTPQNPQAVLQSDSVDGKLTVYWPHHGFVKNNILHTYMIQVVFDPKVLFYVNDLTYFRLNLSDYTLIDKQNVASYPVSKIWYGWGFFELDGYYYTYGGNNSRELHVARGQLINDKLQNWEYFDGIDWNPDPSKTQKLEGIDIRISTQFSIFPHKDKYILITQKPTARDIYSYIADSPTGPWYNKKLLYTTPEPAMDDNIYAYNAMAHPQYDKNNRLLVSYCVNARKGEPAIWEDASIYRPRFLRVSYDYILK